MSTILAASDDCVLNADELLVALARHEREAARIAMAVRRLEGCGDWAADGSVSMAAWLRHHGRLSSRDAFRWIRRGRFLDRFPAIAAAACDRTISAGQVDALQQACPVALESILAEQQVEMVAIVAPLSVADTEQVCRVWKQRAEAVIDTPEPTEPERSMKMGRADDGALVGSFVLDDAAALEFAQAIRNASTWEGGSDERSIHRRNADALFDIAAFYNKNHDKPGTPRNHPHLELSLEADSLDHRPTGFDADQRLIHHATVDTHLCDCVIHRVMRAENIVTGYGRARYTVPKNLFRQIAARDGGCRFPGCDRKVRHCDAHHIRYWRNMGLTELENLVLLCSRHHHVVHRLGLELKLLSCGRVEVSWPDGAHRTSEPRGRPPNASS